VSATILGQAVSAFAFFGLAVPALGLPKRRAACAQPAGWGTIGLSSPATLADVKGYMTIAANNRNQQHEIRP